MDRLIAVRNLDQASLLPQSTRKSSCVQKFATVSGSMLFSSAVSSSVSAACGALGAAVLKNSSGHDNSIGDTAKLLAIGGAITGRAFA